MAEMQELETEVGELEEVQAEIQQAEQKQAAPEIPEKYRGKTVEELVEMHRNTEQTLSRQGQELGEIRRLADELLRERVQSKPKEKPEEVDFFANPEESVRNAVKNSPELLEAQQYLQQAKMEMTRQKLATTHPDFIQIGQSQAFQEWATANPVRKELLIRADAYDFDAASELIGTYKLITAKKQEQVSEVVKADRDKTLKAVAVDTGGSGETTKKIYRRADLIRLKMRDPAKYDEMADSGELARAYEEGRVR